MLNFLTFTNIRNVDNLLKNIFAPAGKSPFRRNTVQQVENEGVC